MLIRRAQHVAFGVDPKPLTTRVRKGELLPVAPGVYVQSAEWHKLFPADQHMLRVFAQSERLQKDVVYSHHSAAVSRGIRLLGPLPDKVSIAIPPTSGGRSTGAVRRRQLRLFDDDIVTFDGIRMTSPARTVIDLARELSFIDGVAMVDSARNRQSGLVTLDDLRAQLLAQSRDVGIGRARAIVSFSTDMSGSVEESRSRMLLYQLGFPEPTLQHKLVIPEGTFYSDFWWEEYEHWGEFDGKQKYVDPTILNGRRPEDVVVEEKRREDAIRRNVRAFSRWGLAENLNPDRLQKILCATGLPTSGRRPFPF